MKSLYRNSFIDSGEVYSHLYCIYGTSFSYVKVVLFLDFFFQLFSHTTLILKRLAKFILPLSNTSQ